MRSPKTAFEFSTPALAALISLALASPAVAHARLLFTLPVANETTAPAPVELRLKFSEAIELKFTKVKLTGPEEIAIETGPPRQDPGDTTLLIVPIAAPLSDGRYTVEWQAVSTDGHKTGGAYYFDLKQ
jgi:methionine-rich copper-binding protein CopC